MSIWSFGKRTPGPSAGRRRALAWAAGVVLVVLVLGAVAAWSQVQAVAPHAAVTDLAGLVADGSAAPRSLAWKLDHDQRINVLLLAHGGAGQDNPNFTDTMVVLSLRAASGRAAVVSLPRFLWVDIPALTLGGISGKLYSAFALGGQPDNPSLRPRYRTVTGAGDLAADTVAEVIGEPIDCWLAIDVEAFPAAVDALGGIRVTVPAPLDDVSYPLDDAGRTGHVHFDPGPQTMNGGRALQYARSRLSTSESDRSSRQELVVAAILDRLRTVPAGPALLPLLVALRRGLLTDLDLAGLRRLFEALRHVDSRTVSRLTLDETNVLSRQPLPEGDYLVVPRDPTLAELRRTVEAVLP